MKLRKPTLRGIPRRHPDYPEPGVCLMPTTDNGIYCPYCGTAGHNEDFATCPQRAQDALRWSRSGKEAYPAAEHLFDALATVALPCGGREVTSEPVRVSVEARQLHSLAESIEATRRRTKLPKMPPRDHDPRTPYLEPERRWHCLACGGHDGLSGGIYNQTGANRGTFRYCRWCDASMVPVELREITLKPKPECATGHQFDEVDPRGTVTSSHCLRCGAPRDKLLHPGEAVWM